MLLYVLFVLYCSMYCLCVNVYCHRVTTQLQLNISSQLEVVVVCLKFCARISVVQLMKIPKFPEWGKANLQAKTLKNAYE